MADSRFHFTHVASGEDKAGMCAVHPLDNRGDPDTAFCAENGLPTQALFAVEADIVEDAAGRGRSLSVELRLGSERMSLVVVDDDKWRQAAGNVDGAGWKRIGRCNSSFQTRRQIAGQLKLRIVEALTQYVLWNGIERQGNSAGNGAQNERVEDDTRTGECVAKHGEMLLR